MSSVSFNRIPQNIVAPIFTFEVNSAGNFQNEGRVLLIGHKSDAGTMQSTKTFPASISEARKLAGKGSMLADMYRVMARSGATDIWILPVAETGVAEIRTLTVDTVPAGVGRIEIGGEAVEVEVATGDDDSTVAASIAAAINAYYDTLSQAELQWTATSNDAVVTVTARHKGAIFNGEDFYIRTTDNVFAGTVTIATATSGTGDPDLSTALGLLNDEPWDIILSPFSDTDSLQDYDDLLNETNGRWAWNRLEYGHVFTVKRGSTSDITTHGSSLDTRHLTTIPIFTGMGHSTPSWRWLCAQVGAVSNWLRDGVAGGVSRAQEGLIVKDVNPPRDRSEWPQYALRDQLLKLGVSTWKVDGAGRVVIDKLVTHYQTLNGAPDTVFRDIQSIYQIIYGLRFMGAQLAFEHSNKIAADDNPGNLDAISTPRDVEATLMHAYRKLVFGGVSENLPEFIRRVKVERNSDNANRYDIFAPIDLTNPLDILATNAVIHSQF